MKRQLLLGVFAFFALLTWPLASAAATFTVDDLGDGADSNTADGVCSDGANFTMRAAIEQANSATSAGADVIEFSVTGNITLVSDLPAISEALTIDGTSAPGFGGSPFVEIDGATTHGLEINVSNVTISSLAIIGAGSNGIFISGTPGVTTGITIQGNHIGVEEDGLTGAGGNDAGIYVTGAFGVVIGGNTAATRNIIGNNGAGGIQLDAGSDGAIVTGNYIGLGIDGSTGLTNGGNGIYATGSNGALADDTYFWRVQAFGGVTASGLSATDSFVIIPLFGRLTLIFLAIGMVLFYLFRR